MQAIQVMGDDAAVRFAGQELARYLRLATGKRLAAQRTGRGQNRDVMFLVGTCEKMGIPRPRRVGEQDDWIRVRPHGRGYILTGSNPRSVLFAVYRYLQACGFRWIRPGRRGQMVPKLRSALKRGVDIDERASYQYRSICIEGACSQQHVTDLIDWMAKHGMNGYFIQFHHGSYFWRRWYHHEGSKYLKSERFDVADVSRTVLKELAKRDMRLERMGHGWTCAPFGIGGEGWDQSKLEPPAAKRKWLAKVNGKREFWHGVPLNTNLCYSNPRVQAEVANAIVQYAKKNLQVEMIHFWLADGSNNNCECARCRKDRPADHYVKMLNELDEKLTAAGIATKIVFLIYVDLLWPPLRHRIQNPDRFILMFAPITRSYLNSFTDRDARGGRMTQFEHNRLKFPRSAAGNLAHLRAWQRQFRGESFDFDYHLIWACYFDFNQFTLAQTLHRDIRGLKGIGLNGLNSCQVQRQFFPHSLLMKVLAATLWDRQISFDEIVRQSFADAYGRDGEKVAKFFLSMSRLNRSFFEPVFIQDLEGTRRSVSKSRQVEQCLHNVTQMRRTARRMAPIVTRHMERNEGAVRWSWRYLSKYLDLLERLLPAYESYLNRAPNTRQLFEKAIDFLWRTEKQLHPVLDVQMAARVLERRIFEIESIDK